MVRLCLKYGSQSRMYVTFHIVVCGTALLCNVLLAPGSGPAFQLSLKEAGSNHMKVPVPRTFGILGFGQYLLSAHNRFFP